MSQTISSQNTENTQIATLAGGCFWCIEAAYDALQGVVHVQSGYAGGHDPNPTYKEVCTGSTGHAEVVQITYDPSIISYETLLEAFWTLHDPTTLNRQGNDVGTQYRSAIFYHSEEQKNLAEASLQKFEEKGIWPGKFTTEITALNNNFYPAEDYHNDYFVNNPNQPYCSAVVKPKLDKFYKKFNDHLKPEFRN
ncbi:MAG: peptide-methionine (S)-S-oxide reductase MsrA [Weeksellaceae bacterium]|nr:peptide-methionine (S)-S-oxide reductase MsrA [Weeksellaceae bacterium]